MQKLFEILQRANQFVITDFLPVHFKGYPIGFVHKTRLPLLTGIHPCLRIDAGKITIDTPVQDFDSLTGFFKTVNAKLVAQGVLTAREDGEMLPIVPSLHQPLGAIHRHASYFWGTRIFGVHLNGLVRKEDGIYMWFSQRAAGRAEAGSFDHLACGGQPIGLSIWDNMCKEAYEEAGITLTLMDAAVAVGMVACVFQNGENFCQFHPIIYDLFLSLDFVPICHDASASVFGMIALKELVQCPEKIRAFKTASRIVIIHLLVRYGYIKPDDDYYLEIVGYLVKGVFPFGTMHY